MPAMPGQMWRVVAHWGGGKIGTGFTNLFFTEGVGTAQAAADAARAFFFTSYGPAGVRLPSNINIVFDGAVDVIDVVDGTLASTIPVTAPLPVTGGDTGHYSALSGACVTWLTGALVGGRRVRGRTFLVPLGAAGLDTDGTIDTSTVTAINTASAALIAATPELTIWRRPTTTAAADGAAFPVVASRLADKAAYLTSRR